MTYDQYWSGDPALAKAYRRADQLRKDRRNEEMWLQGMYVYEAIADCSPLLHAFAKNGVKAHPYPAEPYPLTEKEKKAREERDAKRQREQMMAQMEAWTERINQTISKTKGVTADGRNDRAD